MDEHTGSQPTATDPSDPTQPHGWLPPTLAPPTANGTGDRSWDSPSPRTPTPPQGESRPPRSWPRRLALALVLVVAMVGAGVVGAIVGQQLDEDDVSLPAPPQRASETALDVGEPRDGDLPPIDVADVAEMVGPSVVTISADIESSFGSGGSIGTGVIATEDGEIITNAHVVDGATAIRVRLAGESEPREATLLATDVGNDLALLRVAGEGFEPAEFADPDSVRIGDEVVAIGFALDLDGAPSVTLGIVSALDRTISVSDEVALDGLIQTDAAISSGNSGGPLVNADGEVVGINTAVARGDAMTAASNVGFAISAKEALPIIESLRDQADGQVRKQAYLGVRIEPRQDGGQGAIVALVEDGTPAEDAGIVEGDIVIAVDDVPIDGPAGLVAVIRDHEPGDEVDVVVRRDGEQVTFTVVLAERVEQG